MIGNIIKLINNNTAMISMLLFLTLHTKNTFIMAASDYAEIIERLSMG